MKCLKQYVAELNAQYQTGIAREHSYRPALKSLLDELLSDVIVINEPARISCGAPDYIITKVADDTPVFFIEAKDIDDGDLDGRKQHREQFNRYRQSLDHIVFTDYLDFHVYENGERKETVRIGETCNGCIVAIEEEWPRFCSIMQRLARETAQAVTSAEQLAQVMARKARLMAGIVERALAETTDTYDNQNLHAIYRAFRNVLIAELPQQEFADIYAQTIAYGLFAARLHDNTPEDFSRREAAELIPKTNPFLRQVFNNLAGSDLDDRIAWVVDDLVAVFRTANVPRIMRSYGQNKRHHDPMIHFYEDFLSEYDPTTRDIRGVWYTPQPVVGFIVRAVDEILQRDFCLPEGLADTSLVKCRVAVEQSRDGRTSDGMKHVDKAFHRVQILDPATGTGTFLAEVVNCIYDKFRDQQGAWQQYVEEHLLPRLNGFEILMASYAVAHIKLDMLLAETGYRHLSDKRLHVYLTNSLEKFSEEPRTLFERWLSAEANAADMVKRDKPVMVMIGNPPYSGISANNGKWISQLIDDYKKEPGGIKPLEERKHWLNDDYVKFIRLAQQFVDKNQTGIIGYINNNAFTDNVTFRGMRWSLLRSFDKIYILNLHGSHQIGRTDVCPDGSSDVNVFDITLGVSVNLFVKTGEKEHNELGRVYYADLYGSRAFKYEQLSQWSLEDVGFTELTPSAPNYYFIPKATDGKIEYEQGFQVTDLMPVKVSGIVTMGDKFAVADSEEVLRERLLMVKNNEISIERLKENFSLGKNYADFITKNLKTLNINKESFVPILFRPFDERITYFSEKVLWRPRTKVMANLLHENCALVVSRQCADDWRHVFVTDKIAEFNLTGSAGRFGSGYVFPLWVYRNNMGRLERIPNLDMKILKRIECGLGEVVEPQELFDYIYAVLYAPSYRNRFNSFLKDDFARVPYPTNATYYHQLAAKGAELRKLHLMQGLPAHTGIAFPETGDNVVTECHLDNGRVFINDVQYFGHVPEESWAFMVGGHQPAQKWLKDRKGRTLSFNDIRHYEQIVYALSETRRIMAEVDALYIATESQYMEREENAEGKRGE